MTNHAEKCKRPDYRGESVFKPKFERLIYRFGLPTVIHIGGSVMLESKAAGQSFMRYEHAAQEDRSAPRVKLNIPATMRPSGSSGFQVVVKDLSLSGIACEALTGMKGGTRVWLTLPGLCALQAEIMWNDGTMVGCAFTDLLNPAVLENVLARFPVIVDRQA